MKVKFGFGRCLWDYTRHQVVIFPTIGVIDGRHYFGYTDFTVNFTWLLWGAYIRVTGR